MGDTDYRWMRILGVVAIAVVVTGALNTEPGPGTVGQHLIIAIALAVFAVATIAVIRLPRGEPRVLVPLFIAVVAGASTLVGLQTQGPGFLGVFPAVSAAALRLPMRLAVAVALLAGAALAVAWSVNGNHPVTGIVLNEMGVAAFFVLATFARRLQEANERSQRLVQELEAGRAAQAEAAALGERQRLAREMHDVLAHSLSGLVLNLEGARLMVERDGAEPKVTAAIGRAHRMAKAGLEEARWAIGMLRDEALPGQERLAELAADYEADTGVGCTFTVRGEARDLDGDSRLTLYRVGQEALTNIRKHASPSRVEITLEYGPSGAHLTVEDFDAADHPAPPGGGTGYGLAGMRERAELIGGSLGAGPTSTGFRVELRVP